MNIWDWFWIIGTAIGRPEDFHNVLYAMREKQRQLQQMGAKDDERTQG